MKDLILEKYHISSHPLFAGVDSSYILDIKKNIFIKEFDKGENIFSEGDTLSYIIILLSGKIEINKYMINGTKNIISILQKGGIFAESVALSSNPISPYSTMALEKTFVAFLSTNIIKNNNALLNNMVKILANKNTFLTFKIDCISKTSVKERIYTFLEHYFWKNRSLSIEIPYNKTQLADFLCVDRSSLSRILSKMQKDGLLKIENKIFTLSEEFFKM